MGAGARLAVTPSCRGASASSEQVPATGVGVGFNVGWTRRGVSKGWRWNLARDLLQLYAHPCGFWCPSVVWDPDTHQCTLCSPDAPRTHKWSYSGSCPKSLEDSSWIPFRDHCYTFHMEITLGQKDAMRRCQKGMGELWWWKEKVHPWKWKR